MKRELDRETGSDSGRASFLINLCWKKKTEQNPFSYETNVSQINDVGDNKKKKNLFLWVGVTMSVWFNLRSHKAWSRPVAWPCRVPRRRVSSERWTVSALCVPRPTALDSTAPHCRVAVTVAAVVWLDTARPPSLGTALCLRARPRRTSAPETKKIKVKKKVLIIIN